MDIIGQGMSSDDGTFFSDRQTTSGFAGEYLMTVLDRGRYDSIAVCPERGVAVGTVTAALNGDRRRRGHSPLFIVGFIIILHISVAVYIPVLARIVGHKRHRPGSLSTSPSDSQSNMNISDSLPYSGVISWSSV